MIKKWLIMFFAILIIGIIWFPYYSLLQVPDPNDYGLRSSQIVDFLKYDSEIYNKYIKSGQFSGSPKDLDNRVQENMYKEKLDYTVYFLSSFILLLLFWSYKNLSKKSNFEVIPKYLLYRFYNLPLGLKRLLTTFYIIWLVVTIAIINNWEALLYPFVLFGYWTIISIILWIFEGFKIQRQI